MKLSQGDFKDYGITYEYLCNLRANGVDIKLFLRDVESEIILKDRNKKIQKIKGNIDENSTNN